MRKSRKNRAANMNVKVQKVQKGWITDRYPEYWDKVIVLYKGVCDYNVGDSTYYGEKENWNVCGHPILGWMPMPSVSKINDGENLNGDDKRD